MMVGIKIGGEASIFIDGVMFLWFALTTLSVVLVAVDVRTEPESTVMKWGFVLLTLYSGPFGTFLYVFGCREPLLGLHARYVACALALGPRLDNALCRRRRGPYSGWRRHRRGCKKVQKAIMKRRRTLLSLDFLHLEIRRDSSLKGHSPFTYGVLGVAKT